MPNRRPSPEHQEAVSRRLALLSAELAATRPEPDAWPSEHTRVRPLRVVDDEEDALVGAAPVVPTPGRHASRRGLAGAVPETLRGRFALGPAHVAVVAVLVAVGLAVTCWWVLRGEPDSLEAPTISTPSAAGSKEPLTDASPVAAPAAAATGGSVTVDVEGKVRRPGIAVLDAGDRVVDAIKAAGGARPGVDLAGLNLARVLVDGEQILVGTPAPTGVAASSVPTPGAPGGPLVNLNTASQTELEALPEVGPVTAQAILAWRDEHGGFTAVDELLEVDGIGDATLGQLAPYVTV
ncbi:MAG: Helix-hairpin-helix repeat-containing competence protein ComEA [Nocardioides sp.]|nr:Helix-hairpin-helix repeat-containing competence protein ComEA [Nocardioides sp.]